MRAAIDRLGIREHVTSPYPVGNLGRGKAYL